MFATEDAMVKELVSNLAALFPAFAQVEREVTGGYGIADVVLARLDKSALEDRAHLQAPPAVRPADARLLAALGAVAWDPEALCAAVPLTRAAAKRSLVALENGGRVVRDADGIRRRTRDPYMELVAVEAKLEDWGRALCQARRYLAFAEYSYVALPADRVHRVQELQRDVAGVGLIAVSPTSAEIIVRAPRSAEIQSWRRTFVAEMLADAWTSRTPVARYRSSAFGSPVRAESRSEAARLA